MKNIREYICAALFFIVGAYFFIQGSQYNAMASLVGDVGPSFAPRLLGAALMGLSALHAILVTVKAAAEKRKAAVAAPAGDAAQPAVEAAQADRKASLGGWLSILLLICYAALVGKLGFIITSGIYLFCQILLLSYQKEKQVSKRAVIVALAAPFVIYLFWYYVFKLPLPAGILPLHMLL